MMPHHRRLVVSTSRGRVVCHEMMGPPAAERDQRRGQAAGQSSVAQPRDDRTLF